MTRSLLLANSSVKAFVDLAFASVSRSTEGTFLTGSPTTGVSASFLDFAAPNTPRYEDRNDGAGKMLLLERATTWQTRHSRDITLGPWGNQGGVTVTGSYVEGPDGRKATRVQTAGDATLRWRQSINNTAVSAPMCGSAWVRASIGGTGPACINLYTGGAASNQNSQGEAVLSEIWRRYSVMVANNGGQSEMNLSENDDLSARGGLVAGARDGVYDFVGSEPGRYPTSAVRNTDQYGSAGTPRGADVVTLSSFNAAILTRAARIYQVSPLFASTSLASGDIRWLVTFDDANNGVRFHHDGTGVLIETVQGGTVKASSGYLVFAAHALLGVIAWDPVTAIVSVNGVAGSAGTPWTWTATNIRLGGIYGGSGNEADCRIDSRGVGPAGVPAVSVSTPSAVDVMWWGDSITSGGSGTANIAQWRKYLQGLFDAQPVSGRYYNAVGPLTEAATAFPQDLCFAHNGNDISSLTTYISGASWGALPGDWSTGRRKLIIVVNIGTNDVIVTHHSSATVLADKQTFLLALAAVFPDALFVVDDLFICPSNTNAATFAAINAGHDAIVTALHSAGRKAVRSTTCADISSQVTFLGDFVHPSQPGGADVVIGTARYADIPGWVAAT